MEYAVAMDGVSKEYITPGGTVHALREVTLQVRQGEFLAVMGPSGSGKSTLLSVVAGLEPPTAGRVTLAGREVNRLDETALALLRSTTLGFVFQSYNLIASMTALENVELPARFSSHPPRNLRQRALALLDRLGLSDRLHHLPSQLSGGQQQRVAIARALMNAPRVILGDEPTGNLDSQTGQNMIDLLSEVCRGEGCTLILSTHDPRVAHRADRVITLEDGSLVREEVVR